MGNVDILNHLKAMQFLTLLSGTFILLQCLIFADFFIFRRVLKPDKLEGAFQLRSLKFVFIKLIISFKNLILNCRATFHSNIYLTLIIKNLQICSTFIKRCVKVLHKK